jgi:hypothetical protein
VKGTREKSPINGGNVIAPAADTPGSAATRS